MDAERFYEHYLSLAMGHFRFGSKADITEGCRNVRFVPIADMVAAAYNCGATSASLATG